MHCRFVFFVTLVNQQKKIVYMQHALLSLEILTNHRTHDGSSNNNAVKKTRYVNLSELHISSIFGFLLNKCYLFFLKLHNFKFKSPHMRDFDGQNNLRSSVKAKKDPSLELWTQVKGNNKTFIG